MAEAELVPDLSLDATTSVEAVIGPRTSLWLESLGWTPPSPAAPSGEELVEPVVLVPAPTLNQAVAENEERAQRLVEAQALYQNLKAEASVPEELDSLLAYFGVNVSLFTRSLGESDASAQS